MTRTTSARIAGFTFLFYIVTGITSMAVSSRATGGEGTAARLANMAQHPTEVGLVVLLVLLQCFSALVLAATLYAITRERDPDLAMLALICRVVEGVIGATSIPKDLGLLWLATATGAHAPDPGSTLALAAFLFRIGTYDPVLAATFFAVGSALFAVLLLRGRMIPVGMAWLGVVASVLLVVGLPLRLAGFLHGPVTVLLWIPMAAFEIPFALWLLFRGVSVRAADSALPDEPRQPIGGRT